MERIDRYADLIVRVGANVQPDQTVFVDSAIDHAELVRASPARPIAPAHVSSTPATSIPTSARR